MTKCLSVFYDDLIHTESIMKQLDGKFTVEYKIVGSDVLHVAKDMNLSMLGRLGNKPTYTQKVIFIDFCEHEDNA